MKLTKKEAVRLHRLLWNRISELLLERDDIQDILLVKDLAIEDLEHNGIIEKGQSIISGCFCCDYAVFNVTKTGMSFCSACPIKWTDSTNQCGGEKGLYSKVQRETFLCYFEEASKTAKEIANLPERPDEDFDIL